MKKLGIKFGDNDFAATFLPLLKWLTVETVWTVSPSMIIDFDNKLLNDKAIIAEIINMMSPVQYILSQNKLEYNGLEKVKETKDFDTNVDFIRTKEYLMINPDQVYIDEEVDNYLNGDDFFNGEFFYVDFEISEVSAI